MRRGYFFILSIALALGSCRSIERRAVRSVAEMLSSPSGAGAFTSDDDPQLIADSLPLALKLHEILLGKDPGNAALSAATGRNFVMYSGAFVQMPADMLSDDQWEEAQAGRMRAKSLFRRGRTYLLEALEMRHNGFLEALDAGDYDGATAMLDESDAMDVYWTGLAWLGMASTDPFDMEITTSLDKAVLLLYRTLELDDTISGLHNVMIQVQLTIPSSVLVQVRERSPAAAMFMDMYYEKTGIGADPRKRADYHYYRSLTLSGGGDPAPHITMATAVSVKEQDVSAFKEYLGEALAVDADAYPESKLLIMIYQKKALWLLDRIEDYFLTDS